jgi:hypothetical protein
MARGNTVIRIPAELARALDQVAGARRRSAYAVNVLWREVRLGRQREAVRATAGAWTAENHPELATGGAGYVEKIRTEHDTGYEAILKRQGE